MHALDEPHAAKLHRHLDHCQACHRYHQELVSVAASVQSLQVLTEAPARRFSAEFRLAAADSKHPNFRRVAARYVPRWSWRFALPVVVATIALVVSIVSVLQRHAVPETQTVPQFDFPSVSRFSADLAPTLANYQAVANGSLEDLDQLLTRQSAKPVPAPRPFTAAELALVNIGE